MSPSSDAALEHLQKLNPSDGWSIEHKSGGLSNLVRLTRRKVPLTDSYFLDIHYDVTNTRQVVGILTTTSGGSGGKVQAQVLQILLEIILFIRKQEILKLHLQSKTQHGLTFRQQQQLFLLPITITI